MKKVIMAVIAATTLACTTQSTGEGPAPVETNSALPQITSTTEDGVCALEPAENNPGYEPDLALWAQAADSIFLGTISEVTTIGSPAVIIENAQPTTIEPQDCDGELKLAVNISFVDVVTVAGVPLPGEITIQLSAAKLDFMRTYWSDVDGDLRSNGEPVYTPGSRIGGGIFYRQGQPELTWGLLHQQFEVIDGRVFLGSVDISGYLYCAREPFAIGIPAHFNDAPLADFLSAVEAGFAQNLSQAQSDTLASQQVVSRLSQAEDFWFLSRCHAPVVHVPHNPGDDEIDPDDIE